MLATLTDRRATSATQDGWAFEMKWDGVRSVVYLAGGQVSWSAATAETTPRTYPDVVEAWPASTSTRAVLDGEIVVADETGRPRLRAAAEPDQPDPSRPTSQRAAATWPAQLMVFDLLELNGRSLVREPYERRRELLGPADPRRHRRPGAGAAGLRRRSPGGARHQQGARARGRGGQAARLGLPAGPARADLAEDQAPPDARRW